MSSFAVQMISSDNSTKEVFKGHDRACIVGGLLPGRSYLFQVQAFNRAGVRVRLENLFSLFIHLPLPGEFRVTTL